MEIPLAGRQGLLPRIGDEDLHDGPIHARTAPLPLGGCHPSCRNRTRHKVMYACTAAMTSGHRHAIVSSIVW
jgi:hypothetical protein